MQGFHSSTVARALGKKLIGQIRRLKSAYAVIRHMTDHYIGDVLQSLRSESERHASAPPLGEQLVQDHVGAPEDFRLNLVSPTSLPISSRSGCHGSRNNSQIKRSPSLLGIYGSLTMCLICFYASPQGEAPLWACSWPLVARLPGRTE